MSIQKVYTSVERIIVVGIVLSVAACATSKLPPTAARADDSAVKPCNDTLLYQGSPLDRVIADINRCFGTSFSIDEANGGRRYAGAVQKQYVEAWLEGVAFSYSLIVDRTSPNAVALRSPPDAPQKD